MYHSFLIHSSADGHLGCFHVLAIINSAAMKEKRIKRKKEKTVFCFFFHSLELLALCPKSTDFKQMRQVWGGYFTFLWKNRKCSLSFFKTNWLPGNKFRFTEVLKRYKDSTSFWLSFTNFPDVKIVYNIYYIQHTYI